MKYAFHLLDEFGKRNTLEEMSFGPGLPELVSKGLTQYAKQIKLRVDLRHAGGKPASIHVFKKVSAAEIVQYLNQNAGQSGKYRLLTDDERPYIHIKTSVSSLDSSPATGNRKISNNAKCNKPSHAGRRAMDGKEKGTTQRFGLFGQPSHQQSGHADYGSSFSQTARGKSFPGSRGRGFNTSGRGRGSSGKTRGFVSSEKGRGFGSSGRGRGFSSTVKSRGLSKAGKSQGFTNSGIDQGFTNFGIDEGFTNSGIGQGFTYTGIDEGYNKTGKSQDYNTSCEDPSLGGGGQDFTFQGHEQDFTYNDSGFNDYSYQWEQVESGSMQPGANSCDFTSDQNFNNFEGNNEYF